MICFVYFLIISSVCAFDGANHEEIKPRFDSVMADYTALNKLLSTYQHRVSKKQTEITISSPTELNLLQIDHINYLVSDDLDSIKNWTDFITLIKIGVKSYNLTERVNSIRQVSDKIVRIQENGSINGDCCVIGNVTFEPSDHITAENLVIEKDSLDSVLAGSLTWGFIMKADDVYNEMIIIDNVTFTNDLDANLVESPSINLSTTVQIDDENKHIHIKGNVSFSQLETETVKLNSSDLENSHSLLSLHHIKDSNEIIDLCTVELDQLNITSLAESKIDGIDLTQVLTYHTNQTLIVTLRVTEVQLDGLSLSRKDEFAEHLVSRLKDIVDNGNYMFYDKLTVNSINVSSFGTQIWNDWLVPRHLNESYHFDNVIINGSVELGLVNDFEYEHDLVRLDGNDKISSTIIFENQLMVPEKLARKMCKNVIPSDNWIIKGNLTIKGQLNSIELDKLHQNLVPFTETTDYIEFSEPVDVSDCNFDTIDGVHFTHFMKSLNISSPFIIDRLEVESLILDRVNFSPCNPHEIISSENSPIDRLNIVDLDTNATVNGIEPRLLIVNHRDQDFTQFNGSLDVSQATFTNINIIPKSTDHIDDLDIRDLNKVPLGQLMDLKMSRWPTTVVLKSSSISRLNNSWLSDSLRNVMLNKGDQEIDVDFEFKEKVQFTVPVHFMTDLPSVNLFMDFGDTFKDGDIYFDNLTIEGDLYFTKKLYCLDTLTNVTIKQGVSAETLQVFDRIDSPETVIYTNLTWKVHRKSTITSIPDLIVNNNLTIDKDLII